MTSAENSAPTLPRDRLLRHLVAQPGSNSTFYSRPRASSGARRTSLPTATCQQPRAPRPGRRSMRTPCWTRAGNDRDMQRRQHCVDEELHNLVVELGPGRHKSLTRRPWGSHKYRGLLVEHFSSFRDYLRRGLSVVMQRFKAQRHVWAAQTQKDACLKTNGHTYGKTLGSEQVAVA